MYYILDENHKPIKSTMEEWAEWIEIIENKIVKQETLPDDSFLSTVFLGLDHNFGEYEEPILFETMLFPDWHNEQAEHKAMESDSDRYATWDEAVAGHERMKQKCLSTHK